METEKTTSLEAEWEVLRVGADFRLKCLGCGHPDYDRTEITRKNVKEIVEKA